MNKPALFLDQDGVLADFYAGAERVLGHPWNENTTNTVVDRGKILNKHSSFWENLPPMKDLHVLWGFIEKFQPHILTAVPSWEHEYSEVHAGKWAWVKKHLPGFSQSRFHVVTRSEKAHYAKSGSTQNVLVDDFDKNIAEFQAAGGIGIFHVSAKVTILKLKALGFH